MLYMVLQKMRGEGASQPCGFGGTGCSLASLHNVTHSSVLQNEEQTEVNRQIFCQDKCGGQKSLLLSEKCPSPKLFDLTKGKENRN